MTNPTPHGQVPEALIDLIDAYAETRHRCGGIYNAKTEAARKAVIEALSGVQALSAAPAVAAPAAPTPEHIAAMERAWLWMDNQADQQSKGGHATFDLMMLREERDALRAAIDAAPKAAPGEPSWWRKRADEIEVQVALTGSPEAMRCYTDMRTLLQAAAGAAPQQEAQEPWGACVSGRVFVGGLPEHARKLAEAENLPIQWLYRAPQPAPAPLSDDVVRDAARWRMVALIGNEVMLHPEKRTQAAAVKAYMDATHSGLDLTEAVDAAIAAKERQP